MNISFYKYIKILLLLFCILKPAWAAETYTPEFVKIFVSNGNECIFPLETECILTAKEEDTEFYLKVTVYDEDLISGTDQLAFKLLNPPLWLSVDPDYISSPVNGEITATFTGMPTDEMENTYYIVVNVTDTQNNSIFNDPVKLKIDNINDPPVISGILPASAIEDVQFSFKPVVIDPDLPKQDLNFTLTINGSDPPENFWLTLSSDGTLSGIPDNNNIGIIENIVISVTDGIEIDTLESFDLCVKNSNDAPVFTMEPLINQKADEGKSYEVQLTAEDEDLYWGDGKCVAGCPENVNCKLTYTLLNAPEWLSIDPNNKLVIYENTTDNDDVGIYKDIEVIVSDGQGKIGRLEKFSIEIENVNDPPFLTQIPTQVVVVNEDNPINFIPVTSGIGTTNIVKADDIDLKHGDQLYFSLSQNPSWLEISKISSTEAQLIGVPSNKDVGVYENVTIQVQDIEGTNKTYSFELHVININDPPVFTKLPPSEPIVLDEGALFELVSPEIIVQDVDKEDFITYEMSVSPAAEWLLIKNTANIDPATGIIKSTATFSGIPENADVGNYQVSITCEDNFGEKIYTSFDITVNNINKGPRIITDLSSTIIANEDELFNKNIIAEDEDIPYGDVLFYELTNAPSWLSINKTTGVISGLPDVEDIGITKNILLSVTDGEESDYRIFNLEVQEVNDPPVISGILPTGILGQEFYFKPTASDEEGDTLFFTLNISPEHPEWLKFNHSTGELSGIPTARKGYPMSIEVIDGKGGIAVLDYLVLNVLSGHGDLDVNGSVDLADAVIALQILTGLTPNTLLAGMDSDVNNDGVFGLEEAVFILNSIASH